jgi:hypothetical protein
MLSKPLAKFLASSAQVCMPLFCKNNPGLLVTLHTPPDSLIKLVTELEKYYRAMVISPALSIVMYVPYITYPEVRTALS